VHRNHGGIGRSNIARSVRAEHGEPMESGRQVCRCKLRHARGDAAEQLGAIIERFFQPGNVLASTWIVMLDPGDWTGVWILFCAGDVILRRRL
jgi:hypothetical protein